MKITLVKIGGSVLESEELLNQFLDAFVELDGAKILVHGGGKTSGEWAKAKSIESEFIDGRRITSADFLEIATMVYSGINKQLVAGLQHRGVTALGLSGADGKVIPAKKRSPIPVDFGWVGDPVFDTSIPSFVKDLLYNEITLVFSPLSYDVESGSLLNTNADTIALFLTKTLQEIAEVSLVYAFEHAGVLMDLKDPHSLIAGVTEEEAEQWKTAGIIHSGMLPKLQCGFKALELGAAQVHITKFNALNAGTKLIAYDCTD